MAAVCDYRFCDPVTSRRKRFHCLIAIPVLLTQLAPLPIGPAVMVIPPKQWVKSTPLVALTSNYQIQPWDYSMSVVIDGKAYPIKDKLVRMTIEQLKARHG